MLAVVVDDHDMGVTQIIRGDDHLTNGARQKILYDAAGWEIPAMAHIPLIHGPDGAKLSKRHGALGVDAYRAMGYLPEAMRNYLVRLGWSHGDDEIMSSEEMIAWFDLPAINKAAARFDFAEAREHQRPLPPSEARCGPPRDVHGLAPLPARRGRVPREARPGPAFPAAPGAAAPQGAGEDARRPDRRRGVHRRGAAARSRRSGHGPPRQGRSTRSVGRARARPPRCKRLVGAGARSCRQGATRSRPE